MISGRVTPDEEAWMARLFVAGLGTNHIAERTGRWPQTVRRALRRAGVYEPRLRRLPGTVEDEKPKTRRPRLDERERQRIVNLYRRGYEIRVIEQLTGRPSGTIWRTVQKERL